MPTYDFKCTKCGHTFDRFLKVSNNSEPLEQPCPSCNESGNIEKVIGAPAFSYSTAKLPTNTKLKEKFQQIHENTPGSRLDQVSTITPI